MVGARGVVVIDEKEIVEIVVAYSFVALPVGMMQHAFATDHMRYRPAIAHNGDFAAERIRNVRPSDGDGKRLFVDFMIERQPKSRR